MKNRFDPHRHQLDAREQDALWLEIRNAAREPQARRTAFAPALVVSAAAVALALIGALAFWPASDHGNDPRRSAPLAQRYQVTEESEPVLRDRATGRPVPVLEVLPTPVDDCEEAEDPPAPAVVRGEIREAFTGELLGHAVLTSLDGSVHAAADSNGVFRLFGVTPDQPLSLHLSRLGYTPIDTVLTAAPGETLVVALVMEAMIVAQLDAIDVEGDRYMVDVKSTVREQSIDSSRLSKYAIDSVEDAIAKQAGARPSGNQPYMLGGGTMNVVEGIDGSALQSRSIQVARRKPRPGDENIADTLLSSDEMLSFSNSVTGGTTPPNGEPYELMYFHHAGVNPFVTTDEDNLSTFAVDVDDASYTLARSYIENGHLPPQDAVRVEEFVNVFDGDWPEHRGEDLRIHADGAPSRFGDGYHLLRVGLRARTVGAMDRKPALLIFVIDVSGSMRAGNRLGLVKEALLTLVDDLHEDDQVGLVIYGSIGQVVLEPTGPEDHSRLRKAIASLQTGGSTNAHEGLKLAYDMARDHYEAGHIHRLILCSDGVANNGLTVADQILDDVRRESDRGIQLTTVGFGMGNYNDVLMEKLADTGDGTYHYVDDLDAARNVFRQNLTGLLQTVARDAKIQVEFDPARVLRWRLLGYENRDVADRDFRNDDIDAGEVGSAHVVTALYEVKLADDVVEAMGRSLAWGASAELAVARARWEVPAHDTERAGEVTEIEQKITAADVGRSFGAARSGLRLQAVAAEFAEILRGSFWARESSLADLVPVADATAAGRDGDGAASELVDLIRRAADLAGDGAKEGRTR